MQHISFAIQDKYSTENNIPTLTYYRLFCKHKTRVQTGIFLSPKFFIVQHFSSKTPPFCAQKDFSASISQFHCSTYHPKRPVRNCSPYFSNRLFLLVQTSLRWLCDHQYTWQFVQSLTCSIYYRFRKHRITREWTWIQFTASNSTVLSVMLTCTVPTTNIGHFCSLFQFFETDQAPVSTCKYKWSPWKYDQVGEECASYCNLWVLPAKTANEP